LRLRRKESVDKKIILGALFLLIIQIIFFVFEFENSNIHNPQNQIQIGKITFKRDTVRKKSQSSISWEDSELEENVLAYDSILTLEGSSAKIELLNNTKITLHENTLIVIEPLPQGDEDPKDLFLERGFLQTQIKQKNLKLGSQNWIFEATPGSEITLKSLKDQKME